jgi:hypothetical protein
MIELRRPNSEQGYVWSDDMVEPDATVLFSPATPLP